MSGYPLGRSDKKSIPIMEAKLNISHESEKKSNRFLASGANEIAVKDYFQKVFELNESGNEFPVDLEDVWPLAFSRKDVAVRELTNKFIEGVDYQPLHKNVEQNIGSGGHNKVDYLISVSCLEYLIARRVREVFEVYRMVFHRAVKNVKQSLPSNYIEALEALLKSEKDKLALEEKVKEDEPKVIFAETAIKAREGDDMLVRDIRKRLESHGYFISEIGFRCYLEETKFLVKNRKRWEVTANVMSKGLAHYRYVDGFDDIFTVLITEKGFHSILNALSKPRWFQVFEDCGGRFRDSLEGGASESVFDLDYR